MNITPQIEDVLIQTVFPRLSVLTLSRVIGVLFNRVCSALPCVRRLYLDWVSPIRQHGDVVCGSLNCLHFLEIRGYDDNYLSLTSSLREAFQLSECQLNTVLLRGPTLREGNILSFLQTISRDCTFGKHLQTLYLNVGFWLKLISPRIDLSTSFLSLNWIIFVWKFRLVMTHRTRFGTSKRSFFFILPELWEIGSNLRPHILFSPLCGY
ncbi:hypothetical protein DL96DRAFT_106281 [Flagelloscypha sp. PMI_526]|nr:hypothetical protein DL96DRAFT_106281 [Flagelloscypha sp. PMI_526]